MDRAAHPARFRTAHARQPCTVECEKRSGQAQTEGQRAAPPNRLCTESGGLVAIFDVNDRLRHDSIWDWPGVLPQGDQGMDRFPALQLTAQNPPVAMRLVILSMIFAKVIGVAWAFSRPSRPRITAKPRPPSGWSKGRPRRARFCRTSFSPILVQATRTFVTAIIADASLFFLHLGRQAPEAKWDPCALPPETSCPRHIEGQSGMAGQSFRS